MNEKTKIRLNKLAHNDKGVNGSIATGCLPPPSFFFDPPLLGFIANNFGTALFEASSTWVPSESSYKKQTTSSGRACLFGARLLETRNYSTSSKKALVAPWTEIEICKHDPSKKLVQRYGREISKLDPWFVTGFTKVKVAFTSV